MEKADREVERNHGEELVGAGRQDVAGQDLLEMLRPLRRAIDQEDRGGGRHHIDHADQRLLRQARREPPRDGEQHRGGEREGERIEICGMALHRMAEHERDRGAERGDLREREVDEDHLAAQHLDSEIDVDPQQAQRDQEGRPQQLQGVAHREARDASASTLKSNSAI